MEYGDRFWCVKNGVRLPEMEWPEVKAFRYNDGTSDEGHWLLDTFCVEWTPPWVTRDIVYRMTILGSRDPSMLRFDWDGSSIPRAFRSLVADRMGLDQQVASLFHDMAYCAHDLLLPRNRADTMFREFLSVYGASAAKRDAEYAAVSSFGWSAWGKKPEELEKYRAMFKIDFLTHM